MKLLTMFAAAVVLTACAQIQPVGEEAAIATAAVLAVVPDDLLLWQCGQKKIIIEYLNDARADLTLDGKVIPLRRAVSASGERFVAVNDPSVIFWTKGENAQFVYKNANLACKLVK